MASALPPSKKGRKFHHKSRYGCLQCKQRRTKCDETRPTCSNCAQRGLDCSLRNFEPSSSLQLTTTTRRRSVPSAPLLGWIAASISPIGAGPSFCRSNTRDLELYCHYQAYTAGSLYHQAAFGDIYREELPRLATSYPFVGHGILSMAYVHLATLSPTPPGPLLAEAAFHVNQALPDYQEALKEITERNSAALFAFATLVVLFTLANVNEECSVLLRTARHNPSKRAEACRGLSNSAARVILAHHNIFGIFWQCQRWIASGPLAPLIQRYSPPMLSEPSMSWIRVEDAHLAMLSRLWENNPAIPRAQSWLLSDALNSLRDTFAMVTQLTHLPSSGHHDSETGFTNPDLATIHRKLSAGRLDDLPSVFTWFIRLSPAFVSMVEEGNLYAMVVLAHFAILLSRVCFGKWWMHQLPRHFVEIAALVLGEERREWIKWPLALVSTGSSQVIRSSESYT
ncbi:Zn(II)2Cys6 transcription factor [Aspergillus undulatus]|uniref:Zn(II)2Cys6 transcription factor n=1 Tax=Aspergillus undulatus TaxID=1810928 RepID=UPI003CCDB463